MFVNRATELAWLQERYASERAELIVLYGRRRVGKSALVRRSLDGHPDAVYYQARETSPKLQIEDFADAASSLDPGIEDLKPAWEPLLERLSEQDPVLVVDEFPYLVAADDSVPSTFQRAWDLVLSETSTTLVLVGSSLSVMEDEVLSSRSPLFGRRTGTLDLGPLTIWDAEGFTGQWSPEDRVLAWSIFGGMPHALQYLDASDDLLTNVDRLILTPGAPLYDEGEFLLHQEFSEPAMYVAILEAVASGRREANEIAQEAGIDPNSLGTYLRKLRRTRLLERDIPVTEDPARSRRSRYRLADPFLNFWFRFVWGRRSQLSLDEDDAAERIVGPHLADHASGHFERLCQQALPRLLEASYTRIGSWWYREHEVDVLGLTDGPRLVAGECKFTNEPVGPSVCYDLERTAQEIRWTPPDGTEADLDYVLFSRSGFEEGLVDTASERDDLHLFGLEEILAANPG